jgi:hypothetical protein
MTGNPLGEAKFVCFVIWGIILRDFWRVAFHRSTGPRENETERMLIGGSLSLSFDVELEESSDRCLKFVGGKWPILEELSEQGVRLVVWEKASHFRRDTDELVVEIKWMAAKFAVQQFNQMNRFRDNAINVAVVDNIFRGRLDWGNVSDEFVAMQIEPITKSVTVQISIAVD